MKRQTALMMTVLTTVLIGSGLVAGTAQGKVLGPNGRIVFNHTDPALGELLETANPDGTHVVLLYPGEEARWSPDGSRLATGGGEGSVAAILNPDTGAVRTLKSPDPTLAMLCLAWSPDAKRLACGAWGNGSRDGIYTIRASDGRGLTRITSNPGGLDFLGDWSPDGTRLVFQRTDPSRPQSANQAIFVVGLDGKGLRRISPWGSGAELTDVRAGWSPDGRTILFGENCSLFTVRPDGTGLARIVLQGIDVSSSCPFVPGWSPDGTKIVFAMITNRPGVTAQQNIYIANADGTDVQQVTHDTSMDSHDGSPDWGPHPSAE